MRQPAKTKIGASRAAITKEQNVPPPVGGWNLIDAITSMPKQDAIVLENWYPHPSYVEMRGGSELFHDTLSSTPIKTLAVYSPPSGSDQLWSFTDSGVYNSTTGTAGIPMTMARTNGEHQWENFGDGTNNWLIACNGVDSPFYWNGTTATAVSGATSPAITGVTTTTLIGVAEFKKRLLFVQTNKLGFWYLPSGVAGGAATYFDLSSYAADGGYLQAICVWTRDAGNGPDDYAVFLTSQGQALVYSGTDPGNANAWSLVGTFKIGKPLGRKCVLKFGADPIILTEQGVFPLSALLASGDQRQKFAISYKIQAAFTDAAAGRSDYYGWQTVSYEAKNALIVNVPYSENGRHDQFVMNTITKAWCRFTGWNTQALAVYRGSLYYASGRRVFLAWPRTLGTGAWDTSTGAALTSDAGVTIPYTARQSFQNFGSQLPKHPKLFMPLFELNRQATYSIGFDVDFQESQFSGSTTTVDANHLIWGEGKWGEKLWGSKGAGTNRWGGDHSWPGRWISPKLRLTATDLYGKWLGSVLRYEEGDGL